jgi:hypothetical protein
MYFILTVQSMKLFNFDFIILFKDMIEIIIKIYHKVMILLELVFQC